MKTKLLITIITASLSLSSLSAQAAYNPSEGAAATQQINQGLDQISNAQAPNQITDGKNNISAGIGRIEAMTGGKYDAAASTAANQPAASSASPDTAASAHPDYSGEAARAYNAALTAAKYASANAAQPAANTSATAHPDYSVEASHAKYQALTAIKEQKIQAYQAALVAQRYSAVKNVATGTINVSAASLHPDTAVSVSVNGTTQTTTAGELAALNPTIQVAVPHVQAIISSTIVKGGQDSNGKHNGSGGHEGRGQENAHSHAFGGHGYGADNSRSEGFGGHSHFH